MDDSSEAPADLVSDDELAEAEHAVAQAQGAVARLRLAAENLRSLLGG